MSNFLRAILPYFVDGLRSLVSPKPSRVFAVRREFTTVFFGVSEWEAITDLSQASSELQNEVDSMVKGAFQDASVPILVYSNGALYKRGAGTSPNPSTSQAS